jgi:hypothetical protein
MSRGAWKKPREEREYKERERATPRRPVELVAACADHRGDVLGLAVTISTAKGLQRNVFTHGPTPEALARALRDAAQWIQLEGFR